MMAERYKDLAAGYLPRFFDAKVYGDFMIEAGAAESAAERYAMRAQPSRSLAYLQYAIDQYRKERDPLSAARCLFKFATLSKQFGIYSAAFSKLMEYEDAVSKLELSDAERKRRIFEAEMTKADILHEMGRYAEALEIYHRELSESDSGAHERGKERWLELELAIGNVLRSYVSPEAALGHYQRVFKEMRDSDEGAHSATRSMKTKMLVLQMRRKIAELDFGWPSSPERSREWALRDAYTHLLQYKSEACRHPNLAGKELNEYDNDLSELARAISELPIACPDDPVKDNEARKLALKVLGPWSGLPGTGPARCRARLRDLKEALERATKAGEIEASSSPSPDRRSESHSKDTIPISGNGENSWFHNLTTDVRDLAASQRESRLSNDAKAQSEPDALAAKCLLDLGWYAMIAARSERTGRYEATLKPINASIEGAINKLNQKNPMAMRYELYEAFFECPTLRQVIGGNEARIDSVASSASRAELDTDSATEEKAEKTQEVTKAKDRFKEILGKYYSLPMEERFLASTGLGLAYERLSQLDKAHEVDYLNKAAEAYEEATDTEEDLRASIPVGLRRVFYKESVQGLNRTTPYEHLIKILLERSKKPGNHQSQQDLRKRAVILSDEIKARALAELLARRAEDLLEIKQDARKGDRGNWSFKSCWDEGWKKLEWDHPQSTKGHFRRDREIDDRLSAALRQLNEAYKSGDRERIEAFKLYVTGLRKWHESHIRRMRAWDHATRKYADTQYAQVLWHTEKETTPLIESLDKLTEKNETILLYEVTDTGIIILPIQPDEKSKKLNFCEPTILGPDERSLLAQRRSNFLLSMEPWNEKSLDWGQNEKLWQSLIEPVIDEIETKKKTGKDGQKQRLIIIPDRVVDQIPFGALAVVGKEEETTQETRGRGQRLKSYQRRTVKEPRLMRNDYLICYYPSARLLAINRFRPSDTSTHSKVLVVADPERRTSDEGAEEEAILNESHWKVLKQEHGRDLGALTGKNASEHKLAHCKLDCLRSLAFFVHGIGNSPSKKLLKPGLLLATQDAELIRDKEADFIFSDIAQLQIGADQVVVVACQSGLGRYLPGEGTLSVASAFLYAGARAVVGSLWRVDSQSGAQYGVKLLNALHKNRSSHLPLEVIESIVVDEIKKTKGNEHPRHWTPFIILGSPGSKSKWDELSQGEKDNRLLRLCRDSRPDNWEQVQYELWGLLKADANPNGCSDKLGYKPLHWATKNRSLDVTKELLRAGARINARTRYCETPLILAARSGHTDFVNLFMDYEADPDSRDRSHLTALDYAILRGHLAVVNQLEGYRQLPIWKYRDCLDMWEYQWPYISIHQNAKCDCCLDAD